MRITNHKEANMTAQTGVHMKTAIVTTTIHVPKVVALHQEYYPEAEVYIAGDKKTPHDALRSFIKQLPATRYYAPEDQEKLSWSCSEIIGWNTIQRRNIAALEAVKDGVDSIVLIDDDNIPMARDHIPAMGTLLERPFSGCMINADNRWVDSGAFLVPPVIMRGVSWTKKGGKQSFAPAVREKIGVVAGLSLGDPDINAAEWLVKPPYVTGAHELLETGCIIDHNVWSPFNSQNTAWRRELFPLMFVIPFIGKYDDIWGSYLAERVMRETEYYVYFGKPFSLQARNAHNYIYDLSIEMLGIEHTDHLCDFLDSLTLRGEDVNEKLKFIFTELAKTDFFPREASRAGIAWCDDIAKVWKP
jgi:hypothetical protein